MKDITSILRLAIAIFALPLAATAAVSAHYSYTDNAALTASSPLLESLKAEAEAPVPKATLAGTFRNHTIAIDSDGIVRGRVGSVSDDKGVEGLSETKVFFVKDGEIVHQTYTSADGTFEATGLAAGNYSFVAAGAKGFAAFGVNLSEGESSETINLIEVATINPNFQQLASLVEGKLPKAIVEHVANTENKLDGPIAGSNRVQIVDGGINGRLISLVGDVGSDAKVRLSKGSELVAETTVDAQGLFAFDNVQPGIYEFVAAGSEGIAAISFEAVSQDEVVSVVEETTDMVVAGTDVVQDPGYAAPGLDVATTVGSDGMIVGEQFDIACDTCGDPGIVSTGYAGTEIGCGMAAGGCCGASGGFGGCGGCMGGGGFGGGLASLAKWAVLGWILTELFDNIDFSNNDNLPPVSPSA